MNPLHDVKPFEDRVDVVNTLIEIEKDGKLKYEVDKETGLLKLDRFLYSAVHYPGDYGFIPQTLWDDGDAMDIIILTNRPVHPMTLVQARVIGVLEMTDDDEDDAKIIAVYDCDPRYEEYQDLADIPKHILAELKHFFTTYKVLQGKKTQALNLLGKDKAIEMINRSIELYNNSKK